MRLVAGLLVAGALAAAAPAAAQPRIRLIATGGTIANGPDGHLDADALLASARDRVAFARVEPETFARASSLSLTLADWLALARRVNRVQSEPDLAGIVVTGGTDTLEELAWFLDLTARGAAPVVVTGAMRKPGIPTPTAPGTWPMRCGWRRAPRPGAMASWSCSTA